jgi:hypothetical protein
LKPKALLSDVAYGSKIAFQSLGLVTQTTMKRRKAKGVFKKTLIAQGIAPEVADELAKEYPNPITELFSLLRNST